ncbi:MAG TPA: hypothetical protein PKM63_17650 [Panacibacter sp.]|nr:hypothetical protein [Panacibacter sp.]HNP46123.1 hypothetical protein [Panacibacter sp.]
METLNYAFTFIIGIFAGIVFMYFLELKNYRKKSNRPGTKYVEPAAKQGGPFKEFFRLHRN